MGDLISRSALIEELRGLKTLYGTPMTMRDTQMIHWVIGHIKEQPTAYNVDAVVDELEKNLLHSVDAKAEASIAMSGVSMNMYYGEETAYTKAIEIVKGGGNADIYGAGYKLGYEDGYNIAIDDTQKHISALYKDCLNGTAGDDVLAWNKALDKVREVIKAGGV